VRAYKGYPLFWVLWDWMEVGCFDLTKTPIMMKKRMNNLLAFALLACVGSPVAGQSLEEWKACYQKRGIESIPYSDLRSEAMRQRDIISEYCKGVEWGCTGTRELRANIANMPTGIENMKRERDQLSSKRSSSSNEDERRTLQSSMDELTRKIDDASRRLEEMKSKLAKEVEYMNDKVKVGRRCLEARESTNRIFTSVVSKAGNESDPEVKKLASEMISRWEQGNRDHASEIQKVKDSIANCEKCQSGDK